MMSHDKHLDDTTNFEETLLSREMHLDGVTLKVAPYSYLKFWVFYATFGLAKFTTNRLKTRQSDYFEDTHNVLNYLWVKHIIQFYCCHGNHHDLF